MIIQRIVIPIRFPEGVRMGDGKSLGNTLIQSRNGQNEFLIRGTALTGAIRKWLTKNSDEISPDLKIEEWFGSVHNSKNSNQGNESKIKVFDSVLFSGQSTKNSGSLSLENRTHNLVDRHSGSVVENGLFSMESLPPGVAANLYLVVECEPELSEFAKKLLYRIVSLLDGHLTLGGSSARGIGRTELRSQALWMQYDLSELQQHAQWLDEGFEFRISGKVPESGEKVEANYNAPNHLKITLPLSVPRGQDFVIGSGHGDEFDLEPQTVTNSNGSQSWRIPGSSVRGLFRSWFTRQAARAGQPIADSVKRHEERLSRDAKLTGDELGAGFASAKEKLDFQNNPESIKCPVMQLFGSVFSKGRIHIPDCYSESFSNSDSQKRAHVGIDRFTGGSIEGALFHNRTLAKGKFQLEIIVDNPKEDEAKWIGDCIRALDFGLIRIGSSKGAGRLSLQEPPDAQGPFKEIIQKIQPLESCHE